MSEHQTPGEEAVPSNEPRLLDHEYDGIAEYDNPMPRWWIQLFWVTVAFSAAYIFYYTAGDGQSILDVYEAEMSEVRAQRAREALSQAVSEETLQVALSDSTSVKAGADLFAAKCTPCHAERGEGSIGPNLTDAAWIHGGGTLLGIYKVVAEGVLAKGMPAWDRQLSPTELRQVVAFVGSIRDTNVPGKAAEGTPATK